VDIFTQIMKKIYYVRHGESVANAGGITMDHHVIPLSEKGHKQAVSVVGLLPSNPSSVYASKFIRTQQTAQTYLESVNFSLNIHPQLHELMNIDSALLAGMNGDERKPISDEYWRTANPHARMGEAAEAFIEFSNRVDVVMRDLQHFPNDTVMFGHGIFLALIVWKTLGFPCDTPEGMAAFRRFQIGFPMPNCAVYTLQVGENQSIRVQVKSVFTAGKA
jgi:alpha-ribazole phosphatase